MNRREATASSVGLAPRTLTKIPAFFHPEVGSASYERARLRAEDHDALEELWRTFAPFCGDLPKAFLSDARKNLWPRAWEMRLACTLLAAGAELRRPPSDAPDLCVIVDGSPVWIEASAVDHGTGPDAVPRLECGQMGTIDRDRMLLRYTSALRKKTEQRDEFIRRGVMASRDRFVVAINAGGIQFAGLSRPIPDIVRAVYPLADAHWTLRYTVVGDRMVEANGDLETTYPHRPFIPRVGAQAAGIPVPFYEKECAGISAVLFSGVEKLATTLSDLILVHNVLADASVPHGALSAGQEYWLEPAQSGDGFHLASTRHSGPEEYADARDRGV